MYAFIALMMFAASGFFLLRTIWLIRGIAQLLRPAPRTTADRLRTMRETEKRNDEAVRRWSESHERA